MVVGKEVQVTSVFGHDIILNEKGIYIWDKWNNVHHLSEEGILLQTFSKEDSIEC